MRYSLRTLAIGIAVLGAFFGIMIKLYLEQPEMFLAVRTILVTLVPAVSALLTILWLGLRRNPHRSRPVCAACRHDLRDINPQGKLACSSCGADLSQPNAITFVGDQPRRWGLFTWGVSLVLVPLLIMGGSMLLVPSGDPLSILANRRLIRDRLPNQVNEPWVWNELERRLKKGQLSKQEVGRSDWRIDCLHETDKADRLAGAIALVAFVYPNG